MYIDLLQRWNARINLTAIRNEEEIVTRHFGESLFLARHMFPPGGINGSRVLDIGSGAGFPALPIKIWAPQIQLTLIESNHKKAAFLREVARALTLTNVDVISERAEMLLASSNANSNRRAEVVTLRAVERFDTILPVAASFVAPGGSLALLIGSAQTPALDKISTLQWNTPIPIPGSNNRVLVVGKDVKSGK